jgi:hypothetical protein
VVRLLLIIATLGDLGLAGLLVAVSGFLFGSGPESMHGGALLMAAYVAAIIACATAPMVGFVLSRRGKAGLGLAVALMPLAGALVALIVPPTC